MIALALTFTLFTTPARAELRERATPTSFGAYVAAIPGPQLFETNARAFDARLKLLDAAPKGAHVRVATFEFLNGDVTRRFARHVCLAASRGVRVELIADSKSGDRPGVDDVFDDNDDAQVVEELYQYMANCGAEVRIYNHLDGFITALGTRLPNLFADPSYDGKTVNPLQLLARVDEILGKIAAVANEELLKQGVRADTAPVLTTLRSIALEVLQMLSGAKDGGDSFDTSVERIDGLYHALLNDPAWDAVPPAKLKAALGGIQARLRSDAGLRPVYDVLRRYNRVQHRKLFLVESGTDACLLLGGRNLGDPYLAEGSSSFIDGDVLLCRHHGADASRAVDEAVASFENLLGDRHGRSFDLAIGTVAPNRAFPFRNLLFPTALKPAGLVTGPYPGKLPDAKRTLLPERSWIDEAPVLGEVTLAGAKEWHVLRASWDPEEDEVARALLERVRAETKEIYLETAYAQFSPELRAALETALARGVRVRLVTNSFAVSDGASKAIRAFMAEWTSAMKRRFPSSFRVSLTAADAGHMIHLKSAAFACQKDAAGSPVRAYLLGSHNFQPRSGRSDKENSLAWIEPTSSCDAPALGGFVALRDAYYHGLARRIGRPALADYADFHAELEAALLGRNDDADHVATRWLSIALRRVLFIEGERTFRVREEDRVKKVWQVSHEGGLADLFGLLL